MIDYNIIHILYIATVEPPYSMANSLPYNIICDKNKCSWWTQKGYELTKDTLYLTFMSELWSRICVQFDKKYIL